MLGILVAAFLVGGLALWGLMARISLSEGGALARGATEQAAALDDGGSALPSPATSPGNTASRSSLDGQEEPASTDARGAPLLAAGRVCYPSGAAVREAMVQVLASEVFAATSIDSKNGEPALPVGLGRTGVTGFGAASDSRGRFQVYGETRAAQVDLVISKPGYQDFQQRISPGTAGLEIQLRKIALAGGVLLAEGVPRGGLEVHLRFAGSAAAERSIRVERLSKDKSFEFSTIDPGLYELSFKHPARDDYLHTARPFEVPTDEVTDERLASIDLRNHLRLMSFSVFDSVAAPVFHGTIHWRGSGAPGAIERQKRIDLGAARLVSPWPEIDIRVTAANHETLVLRSVRNGCRLDLAAAGGILLELGYDCDLRGMDLILYLKQSPHRKKRLTFRPTSEGRLQQADLPAPGRWELEWWVIGDRTVTADGTIRYGFSGRLPTSAKPLRGRDYIDVAEIHLAQRFVVQPDAKGLKEVLANRP